MIKTMITTIPECERESEALEAVRSGRWPERCGAELREHVPACQSCSELTAIADTILTSQDDAMRQAEVPRASVIWWRAQRRARQDAARTVRRAAVTLQWVAVLGGAAAGLAVVGVVAFSPLAKWISHAAVELRLLQFDLPSLQSLGTLPLLLVAGTWLLLLPVALYVAWSDRWPKNGRSVY